jgi:Glutaredoxin-like domain (DUF836)
VRATDTGGATLRLTLYGRSYCHLCDEMLAALANLRGEFGTLVPVLMHAGTELCHYHLDTGKVRAYLVKIR